MPFCEGCPIPALAKEAQLVTSKAKRNGAAARKLTSAIGLFYEAVADTGYCSGVRVTDSDVECCTLPSADLEFALGDAVDTLAKQNIFSENVAKALVDFAYGQDSTQ